MLQLTQLWKRGEIRSTMNEGLPEKNIAYFNIEYQQLVHQLHLTQWARLMYLLLLFYFRFSKRPEKFAGCARPERRFAEVDQTYLTSILETVV